MAESARGRLSPGNIGSDGEGVVDGVQVYQGSWMVEACCGCRCLVTHSMVFAPLSTDVVHLPSMNSPRGISTLPL